MRPVPEVISIDSPQALAMASDCSCCREVLDYCLAQCIPSVTTYREGTDFPAFLSHLVYPSSAFEVVNMVDKKIVWNMKNGRDKIVNALWDADDLPTELKAELKSSIKHIDSLIAQVEETVC